jgi:isopentenyl-diphosphate delta-isomerase
MSVVHNLRKEELVVLLDNNGDPCGSRPKGEVHHSDTPLHLAFSCYAFDATGRLLVTRRADSKKTFPGVWTNSCCGHPAPGEPVADAVRRRFDFELGLELTGLTLVLPDFRYRAEMDGLVENEICPVYLCRVHGEPRPRADEVGEFRWTPWPDYVAEAAAGEVSAWSGLQVDELRRGKHVESFLGV